MNSVQNRNNITFGSRKNLLKKAAPYLFGTIIALGGTKACMQENDRYSKINVSDDIIVEYSNVRPITRDSVMKPVYDMKQRLTPENDFLGGTKFDIAESFAEIKANDGFKKHLRERKSRKSLKGTSFYSDGNLQRRIALQEIAHKNSYPEMRQTLMHEVGHQFDNWFGHDHNAEYAQKWDSLICLKDTPYEFLTLTEHDKNLDIEYNYNNSLSDKPKFQKALLKDLQNIGRMKRRHEAMPQNMDYYIGKFDLYNFTPEDIDGENAARAEIYAQLFSYATGQNDGEKEIFVKCFLNCFDVVNEDIERILKIK